MGFPEVMSIKNQYPIGHANRIVYFSSMLSYSSKRQKANSKTLQQANTILTQGDLAFPHSRSSRFSKWLKCENWQVEIPY